MKKRLFLAFPVEVESSLSAAIKKLRINAQQKGMEVNWVPEANFHVTLCFLGPTDVARIPEIEEIMRQVAQETPPLKTSLRGMGGFPDDLHMRVLWIGVRKSRSLGTMQEKLTAALQEKQLMKEDRAYIPHLTVGRLRKARAGRDLFSPYVRTSFGDVDIPSITLFESVMHGASPVYIPVTSVQLVGAPEEETEFT